MINRNHDLPVYFDILGNIRLGLQLVAGVLITLGIERGHIWLAILGLLVSLAAGVFSHQARRALWAADPRPFTSMAGPNPGETTRN